MNSVDLLFLLLFGSFLSLWIPAQRTRQWLSFGLLSGAGLLAFTLEALSFTGILWAGLLFATGTFYHHEQSRPRHIARVVFLGLVLALGFGLLPGFDALVLHGAQMLKAGSAEYTLRIRPDKVLAGFALLAIALPLGRDGHAWRRIISVTTVAIAVTAPLVLGAGWFIGYVDFLPQLPAAGFLAAWMGANLLFVTGVEEGFFRGIIQRSLLPRLGAIGAIGMGAILFGLAHFGGGVLYVALATLAGIGYGAAYHLAGQRIEAAMLTHFGVNLLHLLLFSYPYAI